MKLYLKLSDENIKDEKEKAHELLLKTFNINESDIIKNEYGKPYLKNNEFYFSLSHSKGNVALIKSDTEIGLDIEKIRDYDYSKMIKRIMNENDLSYCSDSISFLKMWTIKEAYTKYLGIGLSINLKDIIIDYKNNTITYMNNMCLKYINGIYNDIIYTIVGLDEEIQYEIL